MQNSIHNCIRAALCDRDIDQWGICRFADCLPLLDCRAKKRLPSDARSVIVCLFPYDIGASPRNVACYAVVRDYHLVAGEILDHLATVLRNAFPAHAFESFVDNSPLREVSAAVLAGLGSRGCHGQLINKTYGAKVLIGAVVSTMEMEPSLPETVACLDCGQCYAACPTGAIRPGKPFEQTRCRSWISQKKGELSEWETTQLRDGGLVWGCDLCIDACPMNTQVLSPVRAFYDSPLPMLREENLSVAMQDRAYAYRGRAVLLRNLAILADAGTLPPHPRQRA